MRHKLLFLGAIAALLIFLSRIYGLPVAIAAAIAWVLPIALLVSFVAPGFRLAFKDRKAEARLVQGQLMGASTVSTANVIGIHQRWISANGIIKSPRGLALICGALGP